MVSKSNKTVICVTGPQGTGKSQTLKKLANKLWDKFGDPEILYPPKTEKGDMIEVFNTPTEKKIGIVSAGDPHGPSQNDTMGLDKLLEEDCDIIFCAARDPATTVTPPNRVSEAVGSAANANGYKVIYVSHLYFMKGSRYGLRPFHDLCHERNADFLLQLMKELLLEHVLF